MSSSSKKHKTKDIECEVRGCITQSDFSELKDGIEKEWGKIEEGPELVIFFKGKYDLRLKINKNGCSLAIKKTVDKETNTKQEIEFRFNFEDVFGAIKFLVHLGFKKGLFSYCYRYDAKKLNRKISIKFNTKIGDLFEIDEIVGEKTKFKQTYNKLIKIANKYGLNVWSQHVYKRIIKESWKDIRPEPLITNGNLHPLIKKVIKESKHRKEIKNYNSAKTIASILKNRSNNYTNLEKVFKEKSGTELLSWSHSKLENYREMVSIIIPNYNSLKTLEITLKSIERQKLNKNQKKLIEVIIIDDGSKNNIEKNLKCRKYNLNIKYIRQNNLGRVYARNLGASIAKGRILIFLDSDIILEDYFLNEHIKRHHYLNNIVLVSFKENVSLLNGIDKWKKHFKPDITKDFRFEKIVKNSWLRMHRHVRNVELRKVQILEETDNFKKFGKDRILGVWDLPAMIVTMAVSFKKEYFDKVGGFNLQFQGWGMEDTFFGACLIAVDNYIIPCFSSGVFHIKHKFRSGSQLKRISEFNHNVLVYLDLINKPINQIFKP